MKDWPLSMKAIALIVVLAIVLPMALKVVSTLATIAIVAVVAGVGYKMITSSQKP